VCAWVRREMGGRRRKCEYFFKLGGGNRRVLYNSGKRRGGEAFFGGKAGEDYEKIPLGITAVERWIEFAEGTAL